MNLNSKQKVAILFGILLITISYLIPPCYFGYNDTVLPLGYKLFATFKANKDNLMFLHTTTFYAQIITIVIITIGSVFIFSNNKKQ